MIRENINNIIYFDDVAMIGTSSYDNIVDAEYTIVEESSIDTTSSIVDSIDKGERVPYRTMVDVMNDGRRLPDKKKLYQEFWFENELCILYAEQGKGKTILAMQIAIELSKTEKVLYLDYEMGDKQLFNRYRDSNKEFDFNENFIHPNDISFENDKGNSIINYIKEMCTVYNIKIVLIDNMSALSHQLESSNSMMSMMGQLNKLKKELGLSILLLGHTKKRKKTAPLEDNDLAGSKKIIALVDSAFAIGCSVRDEKQLYIKQIKVRECEIKYGSSNVIMCVVENFDSHLQLVQTGFCHEETLLNKNANGYSSETLENLIVEYKSTGLSNRQIGKKLEISEGTVRNFLLKIKAREEEKLRKEREKEEDDYMDENENIYSSVANSFLKRKNTTTTALCYA